MGKQLRLLSTTIAASSFALLVQLLSVDTWTEGEKWATVLLLLAMAVGAAFAFHWQAEMRRLGVWGRRVGRGAFLFGIAAYVYAWVLLLDESLLTQIAVLVAALTFTLLSNQLGDVEKVEEV